MKHSGKQIAKGPYHDIHMPCNTALGFYIGIFSFLIGFGMVWHMFWLAIVSTLGIVACCIVYVCQKHHEYNLTAQEIQKIEERRPSV
jgi:cytochrome o ubiquinol oxidase subunit 1